MLNLDGGMAALGVTGDGALMGVALDTKHGEDSLTKIEVIVDGDAVYGTRDLNARLDGALLDLIGATGEQGVATNDGADFLVIGASPAADETLVQINPRRHFRGSVRPAPTHEELDSPTHLTGEEEWQLVSAAASSSASAREELVRAFIPLIRGVARHYERRPGLTVPELTQEGVVGLLRALQRFDPSRGTPFWGYASWWVRQAMQRAVGERTGPMMLSDRARRQLARINSARTEHLKEDKSDPTAAELAEATGLTPDQVKRLLAAERAPRALEEPAGGEAGPAVGEVTPDPEAEQEFEQVIESIELEEMRDLAGLLSDREREIIFSHYGIGRPAQTMREIGERLGISAERVRQIEQFTLKKLRAAADETE